MQINFILLLLIFSISTYTVLFATGDDKPGINGIYKTYNDYKAHKLEKMDEGKSWVRTMNTIYITFKKNGGTEKVKCADIWGFMFKDVLFRIDHNKSGDYPCAVLSFGRIVYYENGAAYLNALINDTNAGTVRWGHKYYFSQTLTSELIPVSSLKEYKEFREQFYAKYKKLFDCLDNKGAGLHVYQECAEEYNKSEGKKEKGEE